jgi:hypothetical protein
MNFSSTPQSYMSNRVHTNAMFKLDDTKKAEPVKRDSIVLNIVKPIENRNMLNYSPKNSVRSPTNRSRMSIDFKMIIKPTQSNLFIQCNRLMNSKDCIYFYIFLMIFSVAVFLYSLIGFIFDLCKNF